MRPYTVNICHVPKTKHADTEFKCTMKQSYIIYHINKTNYVLLAEDG